MGMIEFAVIGVVALGTSLLWKFVINPKLDKRHKKGGFVKPKVTPKGEGDGKRNISNTKNTSAS